MNTNQENIIEVEAYTQIHLSIKLNIENESFINELEKLYKQYVSFLFK
jgi:hypothetical protein